MTVQDVLIAAKQLSRDERLQVLISLLESLRESQGITKTPEVLGGDACIANTRLPVWLFVSLRQQGATDADFLEAYPHLSAADLANVWHYADAHTEEIERALQEQEAALEELE